MKSFMKRLNIKQFRFDGCMFNLRSTAPKTHGKYLQKPWIIASNVDEFRFMQRKCSHDRHLHVKTAGRDTKRTEEYTDEMVDEIHACWLHHLI